MQIEIFPSTTIDKQKWDDCISNSSNSLVYATSTYLDAMAETWDALIVNDYEIVMPVPWKKKFGIKYISGVPFVQQLGVFGKNLQQEHVDEFVQLFQQAYKYGDYAFNYMNIIENATKHNNYILMLSSKYDILRHFYQTNIEKGLQKAKKFSLAYEKGSADETINIFKELYADRFKHVKDHHFKNFSSLCKLMEQKNDLIVRRVVNNNKLMAAVLLIKDKHRLYNLMMAATSAGRDQSAGPFLYNELIKEFSQSGMILDFEGSDIPGIEFFYKGFGAINQPYSKMHINNLALPLRLFKR